MAILDSHHASAIARPYSVADFEMRSDAIFTGGMCFSQTFWNSGMELQFRDVYDGYGISLPVQGVFQVTGKGGDTTCANDSRGLLLDSTLTRTAQISANTVMHRLSIDQRTIHGKLSDLLERPVAKRIRFAPTLRMGSLECEMLRSLMNMVHGGINGETTLSKYPAALTSLTEAVIHLLLESMPHNYSDQLKNTGPAPSPGSVKRAIDYMVENASRPIKVADIAMAAGVGVRALQLGFMNFRSMTPMAYLRLVRLNGVRAELQQGALGKSIAHVALSWGFPHMSSFSAQYARQFGETPSMTLRKSMGAKNAAE